MSISYLYFSERVRSLDRIGDYLFPQSIIISFYSGRKIHIHLKEAREEAFFLVPTQTWMFLDQTIENFTIGPRHTEYNCKHSRYRRYYPLRFKMESGLSFEILQVSISSGKDQTRLEIKNLN